MHKVEDLRRQVTGYTSKHPELAEAHHYDFAITLTDRVDYFVMGLNPGETEEDRRLRPGKGHLNPYGKSEGPFSRSSTCWQKRSQELLGTSDLLYGDFFFWSSHNVGTAFLERFGTRIENSPHLPFCRDMITELLRIYGPKALIIPGIGLTAVVPSLYGVEHLHTERHKGRRIIEHYTDGVRPWLFTKHFSAWPSRDETIAIKQYLTTIDLSSRSNS